MKNEALLAIDDLSVRFGGLVAMDRLNLSIEPRSIHGVIGPNGAGKSTLVNVISGLTRATSGTISYLGEPILGVPPFRLSRQGISRTFQNTEMFSDMSVLDNVLVGMHRHFGYGPLAGVLRLPSFWRSEKRGRDIAMELIELVGLFHAVHEKASNLPFASQRRLEIARALATEPKFLLLDEPAAGLRAGEIDDQRVLLRRIAAEKSLTILLIDHVMPLVMTVCDRITVLNFGRKIAEGTPQEIAANPVVIEAYLGTPKEQKHAEHH